MNLIRRINKVFSFFKISRLLCIDMPGFKLVSGFLCICCFGCGFWLGSTNLNPTPDNASIAEKFKIVFPIIVSVLSGGLFLLWANYYVQGNLVRKEKEFEALIADIENRYKAHIIELQRKLDNSIYRKAQEFEFLCMLLKDLKGFPDNFNYQAFCEDIIELHIQSRLTQELKSYDKQLMCREEILKGFEKGFSEDKNGNIPFYQLVGEACNHVLKIEEPQEWARPFYLDMLAYLKAWLVCSIRHGVTIPIEPFFNRTLEGSPQGVYHGKDSYIEAIRYIREVALKGQEIKQFFPSINSIEIVDRYLEKLIVLLELEHNSTSIPKSYLIY